MHFKERTQVKVELLLRLLDSQGILDRTGVELQTGKSTDSLLVTDKTRGVQQKLNVLKVFDESMHCKDVYDHLSDPAGIVVNTMLKGFNVTLLTYSKAGTGKTHSVFGTDSLYNETRTGFNALNAVFNEVKRHTGNLGVSLNVLEIRYDEERNSEVVEDLLDVTGTKENSSLDFYGFTAVVIKSTIELENTLNLARRRSKSWLAVYNKEKDSYALEYTPNRSHMIFRLSFTDIKEKKQFAFSLADLIGFDESRKDSLEQMSLSQVNKFFDELYTHKERIEHYKADRHKNMKFKNTKSGDFSAVSSHSMKIVSFLSQIMLNAQTLIFSPLSPAFEHPEELLNTFQRLIKLNALRYAVERDSINMSKKVNIMSFPAFSKAVQNYLETYEDAHFRNVAASPNADFNKGYGQVGSPLRGKSSPEPNMSSDKKGRGSPAYKSEEQNHQQSPGSNSRVKVQYEQAMRRIQDLSDQAAQLKKSPTNAEVLHHRETDTERGTQKASGSTSYRPHAENQSRSSAANGASPRHQLSNEHHQQSRPERVHDRQRQVAPKDEDYIADYNERVSSAIHILENFNKTLSSSPRGQNLQAEHTMLKKNYQALWQLFVEGEDVRDQITNDYLKLSTTIQEFKTEYDIRFNDLQLENIKLQSEVRLLKEEKDMKEFLKHYEREITALSSKNSELRDENNKLTVELGTSMRDEIDRVEGMEHAQANLLKKRINEFLRKYERMSKLNEQNEAELLSFRKRERLLNLDKKMLDNIQAKNVSMSRKLESKDEINRAFSEQMKLADKEVKSLKQQLHEKEDANKKLSAEYFAVLEQLSLFKEMMKKENSNMFFDTLQSQRSQVRKTPTKPGEYDSLGLKLRSLNS